jgi:hypothetical protein
MTKEEKLRFMAEVKQNVLNYLQDELEVNTAALKSYEDRESVINGDDQIKRMREIEAMKLRDRIHELNRHIKVINRMYNG